MSTTEALSNVIREMIVQELDKIKTPNLIPINQFCKEKGVSRVTLWRAEKQGRIRLSRIGRKIFVDQESIL